MICQHLTTFWRRDTHRCSTCGANAFKRKDGSFVWPAQDHPRDKWHGQRIMDWFLTEKLYSYNQGCDGFEFQRNNLLNPSTYGYIWVELTLDLDYEMAWMLDVRRHYVDRGADEEHREYLFISSGHGGNSFAWHNWTVKFGDDGQKRLISGLKWFAEQVEKWEL